MLTGAQKIKHEVAREINCSWNDISHPAVSALFCSVHISFGLFENTIAQDSAKICWGVYITTSISGRSIWIK